ACFGEFKTQLQGQLAHPEKLRDAHRLPCCVQVYEVTQSQPRAGVAQRVLGGTAGPGDLLTLTHEIARRLQLPPPPQAHSRPQNGTRDPSATLCAGERVVRLQVMQDPTHEPAAPPMPASAATPPVQEVHNASRLLRSAGPASRTEIPAKFIRPWEFRRS